MPDIQKRADIETTYNKATKQHGLKGIATCSVCGDLYELNTTDAEKFITGRCFKCFMENKCNA